MVTYTFSGLVAPKLALGSRKKEFWIAIWKTDIGFLHDTLSLSSGASRDEAMAHAMKHKPK